MTDKKITPRASGAKAEGRTPDNVSKGILAQPPRYDKAAILQAVEENTPQELRDAPFWILWRFGKPRSDGTPSKPPCNAKGCLIDAHNPEAWLSFEEALAKARSSSKVAGVGFVLTEEGGFVAIDLDNALTEGGELLPAAEDVLTLFVNSGYTEISPSGRGLHILTRGRLPRPKSKFPNWEGLKEIELYSGGQYVTMTGRACGSHWGTITDAQNALDNLWAWLAPEEPERASESPQEPERAPEPPPVSSHVLTDEAIISKARSANATFDALWRGDISAYGGDASSADMALFNALAFWTGGDAAAMERIARRSGLYRDKWDKNKHYLPLTIQKAKERVKEHYNPEGGPSPSSNGKKKSSQRGEITFEERLKRWGAYTARELATMEFPPITWLVEDIIPAGLTLFAGPSKVGKSWFALQVAHAVATGGQVLGKPATKGRVLYMALEDNPRRMKNRQEKQGLPQTDAITYLHRFPVLGPEALAEIRALIEGGDYSLVIIDTLSRVLPPDKKQSDNQDMTQTLGPLQELAGALDVALIVISHHRKKGILARDVVQDIMGSTAQAGVADTILGLYKEEGSYELLLTGRDVEESSYKIRFDKGVTWAWQPVEAAPGVKIGSNRGRIYEAIQALEEEGKPATVKALVEATEIKRPNVTRELKSLIADNVITATKPPGERALHYRIFNPEELESSLFGPEDA